MSSVKFLLRLSLLALVLAAATGLLAAAFKVQPQLSWWMAILYLWALTLLTWRITSRFVSRPAAHVRALMLGNLGRMILSLIFVGITVWKAGKIDIGFVVVFFIGYFLFTFFEILAVLPNLRPDLKETPDLEDGRKT
jgi:hypothetical protein